VQKYRQADVSAVGGNVRQKVEIDVLWKKQEVGWIRLNTDGASRRNIAAGSGGLFRNHDGKWLGGYSRNLGQCSAYIAELWGILDGLQIARDRGFSMVELHVDSSMVVHTLQFRKDGSHVGWRLIQERLLTLEWEIKVCHSYREANACCNTPFSQHINII